MSEYTFLIADDEEIECDGIAKILNESFPNVAVLPFAHTGGELMALARKYRPDIILADINMPGMSGLEALETLQKEGINSRIIINTAYSYFEYAKRAVSLGAVDYLVKPMDRDTFNQTMERVMKGLEQEMLKSRQESMDKQAFQKMLEVAGKAVISSVILGTPDAEELSIWLETMGHTYWGGFFVAGKLGKNIKETDEAEDKEEPENEEELLPGIEDLAEAMLKKESTCLTAVYHEMIIIFFFPGEKIGGRNYGSWISRCLERFAEEVRRIYGRSIQFGVSGWHYDYEEMHYAYLEAVTAIHSAAEGEIVLYKPLGNRGKNLRITEKNVEQLAAYAASRDWKTCRDFLYLQMQRWQDSTLTQAERVVLLVRLLQECSRKVCGYTIFSWNQIRAAAAREKDLGELAQAAAELLSGLEIFEDKANGRTAYVCRSLAYIEEHFTENISLDMAAESLGLSSFYLSRILTQMLQTSFVELLTSARINHAVELMAAQDLVSRNIGLKSGFQSAAYFYKVFKKNTGMTVGEMREFLL